MSELNPNRPHAVNKTGDPRQWLNMPVVPDAQVTGSDTALACHGSGFGEDEARPTNRPTAEVNEVPVISQAINGAILTHRRDEDPVTDSDARIVEASASQHPGWYSVTTFTSSQGLLTITTMSYPRYFGYLFLKYCPHKLRTDRIRSNEV